MKKRLTTVLRGAWPFILTLALWRLSAPFWNPGGILALIPVFYCTFVRPTPWFMPFGIVTCFLIDYKCATVLYWTTIYCALYSAYGFQNYIDLSRWDFGGWRAFTTVFAVTVFILFFRHPNVHHLARNLWLIIWASALYIPITALIQRGRHD